MGGAWVAPETGSTFEVASPFTEQPIGRVVAGSRADMGRAVRAARAAFDTGPWPRMSLTDPHPRRWLCRAATGSHRTAG
ncbi:aldehyde dehydrogenase family protein [Nocardia sp. NPDC047654]|uniref:aldehyde dehydrogenase family protein n=1 Tax=Nocardia sp. NPDC047654 TaxID=3364314 RepID=UPI00371CB993